MTKSSVRAEIVAGGGCGRPTPGMPQSVLRTALATAMLVQAVATNHYEVLNVPRDADASALRTAYKKAALKWHPDKHPEGQQRRDAQRRFEKANEAFSTLNDPQSRAEYDARLAAEARGEVGGSGYAGSAYGPRPPRQPQRSVDVVVQCSLEQLAGWRPINVAFALRKIDPELAAALFLAHPDRCYIYLPHGVRPGGTLRVVMVSGALELQLLIAQRPHRTFQRRGDHLTALRFVPAWHNWRKPAVHMRALGGTRVRLRKKGEPVPRGGVSCTLPGYGMPLSRSERGDLRVTLKLRSVRGSLVRLTAQLGGVVVAAAGAMRVFSGGHAAPRRGLAGIKWLPRLGDGGSRRRRKAKPLRRRKETEGGFRVV
eukprot:Transcript_26876.p1 GENE.Transcript_26876~~Transcript_26876.p1  ORF type:complete len:370 (-),score=44.73 Transcript_26876:973-2082(-)